MRAHCADRIEEGGSVVEFEVVQRLGVVGTPVLDKVCEHGGIKSSAAAGAAFKHDVRMGLNDAVQDAVEPQHIAVGHFTLAIRRKRVGPQVRDRAVEVPFHVINIGVVQDPVDTRDQVILHFFPAHVEDQLIAASDRVPSGDLHRPVRMRAEEIRVLRYHLRLKPDAEFHAQVIDLLNQLIETAFDLLLIDIPVAQAGVIVVTLSKPTVVHDDHLDTHLPGRLRDLDQLDIVKVEEGRFPGVDQHRSLHIPDKFALIHIAADEIVIIVAHLCKALVGIGHEDCRCVKILPGLHGITEQPVINAHDETGLIILVQLNFRQEAARIHKRKSVAGAILLIGHAVAQSNERILLV